jgi:uncharacterized protein YecE (DUF72 family)
LTVDAIEIALKTFYKVPRRESARAWLIREFRFEFSVLL